MFAAGVPFAFASAICNLRRRRGRCTVRIAWLDSPISTVGRPPQSVESEDGGGAVMAATYVDDGVNDGPDASALVVHIATEDLRDVDRNETHAKGKRAERCEEGHSNVAASWSLQVRQRW